MKLIVKFYSLQKSFRVNTRVNPRVNAGVDVGVDENTLTDRRMDGQELACLSCP